MTNRLLSVVIPIYNEDKNLPSLYRELKETLQWLNQNKGYAYEILLINDGSVDKSLEVMKALRAEDACIRIIDMDRNRGEAAALTAGFQMARGSIILSLDGDGQNPPEYLKDLVAKIEQGYKVATGYRLNRKEPLFTRRIPSRIANYLIGCILGLRVRDNGCSLKAYRADIAKRWQLPQGFHRFIPVLFDVKDHEVSEIPVMDRPRLHGKSNYGLRRIPQVLRELITIPFVLKWPDRYEAVSKRVYYFLFSASCAGFLLLMLFSKSWLLYVLEAVLITSALTVGVIRDNLARFNRCQREGAFKATIL